MLALVVQNHPHRSGPDFGREFVCRLACHGSTFSRVGASGNPGAVQFSSALARQLRELAFSSETLIMSQKRHNRSFRTEVSASFDLPRNRPREDHGKMARD